VLHIDALRLGCAAVITHHDQCGGDAPVASSLIFSPCTY